MKICSHWEDPSNVAFHTVWFVSKQLCALTLTVNLTSSSPHRETTLMSSGSCSLTAGCARCQRSAGAHREVRRKGDAHSLLTLFSANSSTLLINTLILLIQISMLSQGVSGNDGPPGSPGDRVRKSVVSMTLSVSDWCPVVLTWFVF